MARFTQANTPLFEWVAPLIGGILLADRLAPPFWWSALAVGVVFVSVCWFWGWKGSNRPLLWFALAVAGFGLTRLHEPHKDVPRGERLTFLGSVETLPARSANGKWNKSEARLLCYRDSTGGWTTSRERVELYVDTSQRYGVGDRIEFRARLYDIDSGYGEYLRHKGITGRCYAWRVETVAADTTLSQRWELVRARLAGRFEASNNHAGMVRALSIGDRGGLDRALRQSYARTGTAHLLSVSGLHVGIIFLVINLLFGWIRLFRGGIYWMGCLVIVLLMGYALLTGLSPSVLRAVLMFSLLQVGWMLSRYTNSFNTLCFAALVLLLWNPMLLYDLSFQLSFAAMAGILTLYPPLYHRWIPRNAPLRWLWSLTLVGLTAQLATIPLAAHHFGQIPLVGLLLNPLIWFTSPAIIVGGLLYLLTDWEWVSYVAEWVAKVQNEVIDWMAAQWWVSIEGVYPGGWLCLGYYLLLGGLVWWVHQRLPDPAERLRRA